MNNPEYKFEFALEVLNHLGRGLYRNFITVIAEAISNSWDAEAESVYITIDKNAKSMVIQDNGKGMDDSDFRNKFLKVGYSRREDDDNQSTRKVLGRKGIGKLAMLSVSEQVTVASKKENKDIIGGVVDNKELDIGIKNNSKYSLGELKKDYSSIGEHGTLIEFNNIKPSMNNPKIIRKYLAILFNFSFSFENETFDIYINNEKISTDDLKELNEKTQFCWAYSEDDSFVSQMKDRFSHLAELKDDPLPKKQKPLTFEYGSQKSAQIKGFVSSVKKPADLKIHGTGGDFQAGLHLFVNGRLRQENIFKDIASQRIVESYLYGEIHVDSFDDGEDIFTSNREGVIKDDERYISFLKILKEVQNTVLTDWDKWRVEINDKQIQSGDISFDNLTIKNQKEIKKFLKKDEDSDWKRIFREEFMKNVLPKPDVVEKRDSGEKIRRKILISHSSESLKDANFVYDLLVYCGFIPEEIIHANSKNSVSTLPAKKPLEHIREFYVTEWYKKPTVFFVISDEFESKWSCCLEAGAAWVSATEHKVMMLKDGPPKSPLNPDDDLFFSKSDISDRPINVFKIFESLCQQHGKQMPSEEDFKKQLEILR